MLELDAVEGSDFYFIEANDPDEGVRKLLVLDAASRHLPPGDCFAMVRDRIPARFGLDPVHDVQVLCPMNRGGLEARALNAELQQALNPP